jgi:aryl-alcohol dehydrogenase-like predicted oxidoreductase
MEFRRLGRSGLKVSEISYGNWLTHGSQVEAEQATACVHEALEVGITTFDTADVYAQTKAETVLGEALKGQRREGLEIFTKVYWPTGPGPERPRPVAQAHPESLHGSLRRCRPTTSTSTRRTATTPRRRSRRRSRPSTTWCARARCSTSASASGRPPRSRRR